MDKRTLLLVFSFTLILLFINQYFQQQNDESVRIWHQQQTAKKQEKVANLEALLQKHQNSTSELPVVSLFQQEGGKEFLSHGLLFEPFILALSWNKEAAPAEIYASPSPTDSPKKFHLTFQQKGEEGLLVYQEAAEQPLPIPRFPEFGTYDLQLVTPLATQSPSYLTQLGNYTDGHFSLPQEELTKLKKQLDEHYTPPPTLMNTAIVLFKREGQAYPVAIYRKNSPALTYLSEMPDLSTQMIAPQSSAQQAAQEELFYVLETPYQQLVFSNYGGALAEINLPVQSKQNPKSVVKEIEFDREMVAHHPNNAYFPAHPYFTPAEGKDSQNFQYHTQGQLGGYYPLLRRDLFPSGNQKIVRISPVHYAFNLISEYPEISHLVYTVKHFDHNSITFEANQGFRRITKTYTLEENEKNAPYCFNATIKIEGDSRGLWVTSGVPEVEIISGSPAPALKYRITRKGKSEVVSISPPSDATTVTSIFPDWICNSNGFLGTILDPLTEIDPGLRVDHVSGIEVPSRLTVLGQQTDRFKAQDLPGYMTLLPLKSSGGTATFRMFAGPFASKVLKTVDTTFSNPETGYNPDYIACQSFHGWFSFISEPFAKFLFILMQFFYAVTGSWAFSIVLLTVALRIMLYPLNAWSTKSMLRLQQIAPEVKAIQERYKKDPKKAQLEVMNLYKERGVNPVSGCLPLLIQMPFLIGMFDLLKSTFELRGASFIPGWIDNLTAPDVLFSWATPIPLIGNQFHLLPILLGAVMWMQQRFMSSAPKDANQMTEQERQQRVMGNMMAVVFTVMFYQFPSGLNIYWLSSMLLGMLQQGWTSRKMKKETAKILAAPLPPKVKKETKK
ncbi:membrane protein insertase YidC [Parachlamydia sp. AcF125]|uniref:membrane protein insertase YidC n=1 Tax=Parachlamydia sp. AcF125 TaxID=2795736 RepID=UPI001BCA4C58|nr:membrane protein insertase YidC [Parachlamydia sp. AcF125]MBS4168569.1 Membrane protein insertase YidC [Parachlamydia sp. AcF125]